MGDVKGCSRFWAGVQAGRHIREACQGAVHFEHVADGHDALGGIGAVTSIGVDATERIRVQTEARSKPQALSAGPDTFGQEFRQ